MKVKSLAIYSYNGNKRHLSFNINGINIITGRSSTGKSALGEIIEYCMGRSSFNVPEGVIRDKVAWFAVIYKFNDDDVLVAKPAPKHGFNSCSQAMLRRGHNLSMPEYKDLSINSDDDAVVKMLSSILGIPENKTNVAIENSRQSYPANIKHTYYYLFQKQGIITNKDQLFYRQNEQYQPQAIKDTLPILLGITSDDRLELESKLRLAKRDLRLKEKLIEEAKAFIDTSFHKGVSLLSEAVAVGIINSQSSPGDVENLIEILRTTIKWKPSPIPEEDGARISEIENIISSLREKRRDFEIKLKNAKQFSENADGFSGEAGEHLDRLKSINALPKNSNTGEWQWPFSEKDLGMSSPIAMALLEELQSLENEIRMVNGDRPKLEKYIIELKENISEITEEIRIKELEITAAIAANEEIEAMGSRATAAAKVVGRISLFLEGFHSDDNTKQLVNDYNRLKLHVESLEKKIESDDSNERLSSVLNNISSRAAQFVKLLKAEFCEFPLRFDLHGMTVIVDRPDRPVPLNRIGGGENHLAYHLSSILALHQFASENKRPIPGFLLIDQPTQVYFPSEKVYKEADGSIEKTESDADVDAVRRLFKFLYDYSKKYNPGFQLIITEHANLADTWFQKALVEPPWTKPPALVPDNWPLGKNE